MEQLLWKIIWQSCTELLYDSAVLLLDTHKRNENLYLDKNLHIKVHSSIIPKSKMMEPTQVFNQLMDDKKKNKVYPYIRIHRQLKSGTCYNTDEPKNHYAK